MIKGRLSMALENFANDNANPLRIAIIGASGGIGGALAGQLAQGGQAGAVYALSRNPDRSAVAEHPVKWLSLDLTDETSIVNAAAQIASEGELDIVLIASGILHDDGLQPEKDWRMLDGKGMAKVFAINAIGPALVMKHFAPLLAKNRRTVMAALSARVGSIADNRLGGWYSYRSSKAALNQLLRTFSIELARKNRHAIVLGLHPGTVATSLSQPFQANANERFTPDQSARYLLSVIDKADASMSGKVYDWKGDQVPE